MFYVPLAQTVDYTNELMKRIELQSHFIGGLLLVTNAPPGALEPLITKALAEVDPNLTITSVRTMQQQVELSFDQERAVASLAGLFGIVALLLAAIGLYGVTAYTVAQRTNEIGIRMALGADRGNVVGLVLRGAFTRVVIGLVARPAAGGRRGPSDCRRSCTACAFWDPLGAGRRGRIAGALRVVRGASSRPAARRRSTDDGAKIGVGAIAPSVDPSAAPGSASRHGCPRDARG